MTWIVGFVLPKSSDKALPLGRQSADLCLVVGILGQSLRLARPGSALIRVTEGVLTELVT